MATNNDPLLSPPGPLVQKVNAALHREPLASVAHAIYWIFALTVVTPTASMFLCLQAVYAVVAWALQWTGVDAHHPQKGGAKKKEMAIVITGCDSGFGKELALVASNAGFVVFAGCLSKDSFAQFKETTVIPLVMDVTKDKDVEAAVQAVQNWIIAKDSNKNESSSRVLHALCNNAGILLPGFVDWNDLSSIQKTMDGTLLETLRVAGVVVVANF